eukprot:CAMPEP_0117424186 /NCGR_PEP_ID=MMETSP0758-20121206/4656_1 /TAXON_ID=63605 /ORGANISM="Percolomonas cosmopolitus, Strain AE-1 (ATCC 50343)" /LENGTH=483 /DNA_ID=CAMNT_0005207815 /DNA_START=17 /DNA_END=1468 /DNA_ORIENTATION=-
MLGIIEFIKEELLLHPYRFVFDLILLVFTAWVIFKPSYKLPKDVELSKEEAEELLEEWNPKPLTPAISEDTISNFKRNRIVVNGFPGAYIKLTSPVQKEVINFGTNNFLNLSENEENIANAREAIKFYGVGSCGPRGFYGSQRSHIDLEKIVADYWGSEECILYSFGFATIASVIPAFAKHQDLVIVDDRCDFSIQTGTKISRCKVMQFKHNDLNDLERILIKITKEDKKLAKIHTKQLRLIIVQGVYPTTGQICNLKRLVELRNKYKIRIVVEDSYGVGVLGKEGRGSLEHWGLKITEDIDILSFNLEHSFGSIGGVCVGSQEMTEHQRLNGLGYCFSAAQPPYTSICAANIIQNFPKNIDKLDRFKANNIYFETALTKALSGTKWNLSGSAPSPIFHISPQPLTESITREEYDTLIKYLENIQLNALNIGVAIQVPNRVDTEWVTYSPSIRVSVNSNHTKNDIDQGVQYLRQALESTPFPH